MARIAPGLRCNRCVAQAIASAVPRQGRIREQDVRSAFASDPDLHILS